MKLHAFLQIQPRLHPYWLLVALVCSLFTPIYAQEVTGGTAQVSLQTPSVALYGMSVEVGVKVDIATVSGPVPVCLAGFAVPVGYDPAIFTLTGVESDPAAWDAFSGTEPGLAASQGWFAVSGGTADTTLPHQDTYIVATFRGRVLGFGRLTFAIGPPGLPDQSRLVLSSQWTQEHGGPMAIPAAGTDRQVWCLGKIVAAADDYGGDPGTDAVVYDLDNEYWYIKGVGNHKWGGAGKIPVPGDYNGDGVADIAVYDPATGAWQVRNVGTYTWGRPQAIPVPGDYDGDGDTDCALYDPANGWWYVRGIGNFKWCTASPSTDVPVPADYDGDGTTDPTVYDPHTGYWYIRGVGNYKWYRTNMILVPGDYDGDGAANLALYDPGNGFWYIRDMGNFKWCTSTPATDIPVPGDYDGNGTTEMAVFNPANGFWYVKNGTNFKWFRANGIYISK